MVRFLLDDQRIDMEVRATETALDLIRNRLNRTGTKEGCAEGDCGACTVLLGEKDDTNGILWRAVNACILFAPMLDGKALMTVESLDRDGELAPVQCEMIDRHGSQCGFCTPGFVMSLHGRAIGAMGTEGRPVADVLSGNLCRCTGYGPILAAGKAVPARAYDDASTRSALEEIRPAKRGADWFAPISSDALADLLITHPDARIVAGATDVGLWVTKQQRDLGTVIFIGDIADLRTIEETQEGVHLGAGVRYSEAWDALGRLHPELGELKRHHVEPSQVEFTPAGVVAGDTIMPFADLYRLAHMAQVSLAASGYYSTPDIHYDRTRHRGRPFYYFAYGAACSEVVIDTLTGEHRVLRVDILHDVGRSLNPAIDLGQIEGGFIQGMGWLTTEELVFDGLGRLLTHAPSTYKIPTASDRPHRMDIRLWGRGRNVEPTIHRSKAVGEPPFMLAISVHSALTQAVAAAAPAKGLPNLDAPATPERVLAAITELRERDD